MITKEKSSGLTLLPCKPDVCQECAVDHDATQPHNNQSLYYQYHFYAKHQRFPTWKDAIAHCDINTRKAWEKELRARAAWTEPHD